MPFAIVLPIRFHEAIAAATRRKVVLPDSYYGELQGQARSQAFTISGLTTAAQLQGALDAMNEGLRRGMTFGEWKALAVKQDWALPDHRLDLILRNHAQTAYNAGAWEQIDRVKDRRGFLLYSAINDGRTRPNHKAMDGIVRAVDDTFWDTHSPPCGYNCRCGVISLTEEQANDRGGVTANIPTDAYADPGWGSRPLLQNPLSLEALARVAIDVPAPLQQDILDFHDAIKDERIADRVQAFIPDYRDIASHPVVRDFLHENDGLVIEHEAVALRAYTGDYYMRINNFLRGTAGTDRNMMATVSAASSGLSKLSAYEGTVYRGMRLDGLLNPQAFLEAHAVGEVVEYRAFTSASYEEPFHGDVHYTIRSLSGRIVDEISEHPSETEVLFAPGTKFRVVAIDASVHPVSIELEELADQTVQVPANRRFSKKKHSAPPPQAVMDRMQSEVADPDPAALERFMAEHDGMTPIQFALSQFPSARMEVEGAFPHLVAPKKKGR